MKKLSKILSLALAMAMLLGMTTMAAEVKDAKVAENTKAEIWSIAGAGGATVTFDNSNDQMIHVTYAHADLDGEYLVMMITATEGKDGFTMADPGDQTIKYIDQMTAKDVGGTPTIEFDVYPSNLADSIIVIYGLMPGGGKSLKAAIVEAKYILGDVDDSGSVDIGDVVAILRFLAEYDPIGSFLLEAGDVDNSGGVDIGDVVKLLRVFAMYDEL